MCRVGRGEFASERAGGLRRKRRTCGRGQAAVRADGEGVDQEGPEVGGADLDADQVGPGRVEQDVARVGRARERNARAGQWSQVAAPIDGETGVVAAGARQLVPLVGYVDEV